MTELQTFNLRTVARSQSIHVLISPPPPLFASPCFPSLIVLLVPKQGASKQAKQVGQLAGLMSDLAVQAMKRQAGKSGSGGRHSVNALALFVARGTTPLLFPVFVWVIAARRDALMDVSRGKGNHSLGSLA